MSYLDDIEWPPGRTVSNDEEGNAVLAKKDDNGGSAKGGSEKSSSGTPLVQGDRARKGRIGETLKGVYNDTVSETVPSEFLDLLNKLN